MDYFDLRSGPRGPALWCEDVPLETIAAEVGTPVYVYSSATLRRHYRVFRDAFAPYRTALGQPLVAYAVKANSNVSVLATLAAEGAGADTVSEGEVRRALAAGIPAERIIFSGAGKTTRELEFAVARGVGQINVESEPELDRLERVAAAQSARPAVAFRITPEVASAGGHAKISTGATQNKFGVSMGEAERLYARTAASPHLRPVGLACHIGSQITDLGPLERAFGVMRDMVQRLRAQGFNVDRLDLGGGLGVPYFDQPSPPPPSALAEMTARAVGGLDVELAFEPGRLIVANAGVLLATVVHVHERPEGPRFLVLDAGMNDLLRPAMYDAWHDIRPLQPRSDERVAYDVVGPVCETGDTFGRDRLMPRLQAGERVAFMTAGAYGSVMASEYNARPLAPEVLVDGDRWAVVRARPSYEEMLARERPAPWLTHA